LNPKKVTLRNPPNAPTRKKKFNHQNIEFEFTAQPQSDKFVVEVKKPTPSVDDNVDEVQRDWPFKMVCEHLCLDLFDPAWEIRHGAGIGLRSILKAHGDGAGKRCK